MTNKRQCYVLKLKNKNCQNIKRLPHSFLFPEGQMHQNQSVSYLFLCYCFVETIFVMKLSTHATK